MKKFVLLFVGFYFIFSLNGLAQCKFQKNPQENINIKPYCGVDTDIGTKFKVYYSALKKNSVYEWSKQLILSFVKSGEEYYIYCQPVFNSSDIEFRVTDPLIFTFKNEETMSVYPCKKKSYTLSHSQQIASPILVYQISEDQLRQIVIYDNRIESIGIAHIRSSDSNPEGVYFYLNKSMAKKMSEAASCILSQ